MSTMWETVEDGPGHDTNRMPVPGGWLYRHRTYQSSDDEGFDAMSVVFVPAYREIS